MIIDKWLTKDKKAPRKQRHTARSVHKRLKDDVDSYFSYRLVAACVAGKKKETRLKKQEGYLPLEHPPGEAHFGYTDFYENGRQYHEA